MRIERQQQLERRRQQRRHRTRRINTPKTASLTGGKKGGTLSVLNHEDFEHIDPGQSYFSIDYEAVYATQRPLYSYKPNTFSEITPDSAEGMPTISDGGKLVTVKIRHGIHFSPPVNREVTSADVAYAIDRAANPSVANPYYLGLLQLGRRHEDRQRRPDQGHPDAGQVHDRLPPDRTARRRSSQPRWSCR